jgi:phosphatidylglycerophosphatase A
MGKLKRFIVTLIATALGSGLSPKAPGTAGSALAVCLVFLIRDWNASSSILLWTILFFSGWWATLQWSVAHQAKDSSSIVIDEVLGYMISVSILPKVTSILWIQFFLFRLFDVLKPPPIRQLDQWGKRFPIGPIQSFGVILDDLIAGVFALASFYLLKSFLVSTGIVDSSHFIVSGLNF